MILTRSYIEAHKTDMGAWTRSQMQAIGVKWPQPKGWIQEAEGREITEENARIFEAKQTARQAKVNKMSPDGIANSLLSKAHLLSDKKLRILINKLKEERNFRLRKQDESRG